MPEQHDWRTDADYDFIDRLTTSELAWEFLRRNEDYRKAYESLAARGQLDSDQARAVAEQRIFWTPNADPGAILLHRMSLAPGDSAAAEDFIRAHPFDRIDALHLRIDVAGERLEITRIDAPSDGILVAVLILDAAALDRLHALSRFCAMLFRRRVPTDIRLTSQRRRRIRQMLRAYDARLDGATYREIAIAIYGDARIAAEPWKTSSLRDAVIGLVEGSFAMTSGGYLQLLRHRHRS